MECVKHQSHDCISFESGCQSLVFKCESHFQGPNKSVFGQSNFVDLTEDNYGHWREYVAETIENMGMTFLKYSAYSGLKFHVYKELLKVRMRCYSKINKVRYTPNKLTENFDNMPPQVQERPYGLSAILQPKLQRTLSQSASKPTRIPSDDSLILHKAGSAEAIIRLPSSK